MPLQTGQFLIRSYLIGLPLVATYHFPRLRYDYLNMKKTTINKSLNSHDTINEIGKLRTDLIEKYVKQCLFYPSNTMIGLAKNISQFWNRHIYPTELAELNKQRGK